MRLLTIMFALVSLAEFSFGNISNTNITTTGKSEEMRKEARDKAVAEWKECLEAHKKERLHLYRMKGGTRCSFPRTGGLLFDHKDFISYVELVEGEDTSKQLCKIRAFCKVHGREMSLIPDYFLLEAKIQRERDDGTKYEETLTMTNGFQPVFPVAQNTYVKWSNDKGVVYAPDMVEVSESSEHEYEERVTQIKLANP